MRLSKKMQIDESDKKQEKVEKGRVKLYKNTKTKPYQFSCNRSNDEKNDVRK